MTLPNRIRELRKAKRLTLKELGRLADIKYHHLSRLERGEKGLTGESILNLAAALRIHPGEIFEPLPKALGPTADPELREAQLSLSLLTHDQRSVVFPVVHSFAKRGNKPRKKVPTANGGN